MKISFTISEGKGIVKAFGEASASMFLSVGVGEEEEEEGFVVCVYALVSLTSVSLWIVVVGNGLPAHL